MTRLNLWRCAWVIRHTWWIVVPVVMWIVDRCVPTSLWGFTAGIVVGSVVITSAWICAVGP